MPMIKVRRSYQVTIPKKIAEATGLQEGDYLQVEPHEEGILLKPMKAIFIEKTRLTEEEVLKHVNNGEMTSSRGAEILNMPYQDFLDLMAKAGVPVWNYTEEELKLTDKHAEKLFSQE